MEFIVISGTCYRTTTFRFDNAVSAYRAMLWENWSAYAKVQFEADEEAYREAHSLYFKRDDTGRIAPERLPGYLGKSEVKGNF